MNFVLILYVIWSLVVIGWAYNRTVNLDNREAGLDDYAAGLEDWELGFKVRKVALDGLLMYARRVATVTPGLPERLAEIEREHFGDKEDE